MKETPGLGSGVDHTDDHFLVRLGKPKSQEGRKLEVASWLSERTVAAEVA